MHPHIAALQEVIAEIEALTEQDDWPGLAAADERARERVVAAGDAAKKGEAPLDAVLMQLDVLQLVFERARAKAVFARDEAASSLRSTNQIYKAAQTYLGTLSRGS
ncbi:MAG: hypothetical protein EA349_13310 [Halomonadaceae bacterium]|nr:MAG: hypothetical protein EA349_13310 [Halomonadaceae bacterium]